MKEDVATIRDGIDVGLMLRVVRCVDLARGILYLAYGRLSVASGDE